MSEKTFNIINNIFNADVLEFYDAREKNFETLLEEAEKTDIIIEKFDLLSCAFVLEWDNELIEKKLLKLCEKEIKLVGNTLQLYPNNFELNFIIGQNYLKMKNFENARLYFTKCLGITNEPKLKSVIYFSIGNIYFKLNQIKNAYIYFQKALTFDPNNNDYLNMSGVCNILYGNYNKALFFFEKIELTNMTDIQKSDFYTNLSFIYNGMKNNMLSYELIDNAIKLNPKNFNVFQNKILQYLYDTTKTSEEIYEETCKINDYFEIQHRNFERPMEIKDLKIGILTGDFNKHPVLYFMKNFIEDTRPCIYSNGDCIYPEGKNIEGRTAQEVCDIIMSDRIDLLIDLSGYTNKNRMDVLALKPAPFIINYLGYPASTGLSTVDFRLTDIFIDKDNQKYNSEKLLFFKNSCFLNFNYSHITTPIEKRTSENQIIFGSFNKIQKINEEVLQLWSKILEEIPNSLIYFKSKEFKMKENQEFVLRYLPKERVKFLDYKISTSLHYSDFNDIDITLDTYPYSGTTTTCDALTMGVPVISLLDTSKHQQSVSACILEKSGLSQFIAESPEDYIEKCILYSDKTRYNPQEISNKFKNGFVCNYQVWKTEFYNILKEFIW